MWMICASVNGKLFLQRFENFVQLIPQIICSELFFLFQGGLIGGAVYLQRYYICKKLCRFGGLELRNIPSNIRLSLTDQPFHLVSILAGLTVYGTKFQQSAATNKC